MLDRGDIPQGDFFLGLLDVEKRNEGVCGSRLLLMCHFSEKPMEILGDFWMLAIFKFSRTKYFLSLKDVFLFDEVG